MAEAPRAGNRGEPRSSAALGLGPKPRARGTEAAETALAAIKAPLWLFLQAGPGAVGCALAGGVRPHDAHAQELQEDVVRGTLGSALKPRPASRGPYGLPLSLTSPLYLRLMTARFTDASLPTGAFA